MDDMEPRLAEVDPAATQPRAKTELSTSAARAAIRVMGRSVDLEGLGAVSRVFIAIYRKRCAVFLSIIEERGGMQVAI